MSQHLDSMPSRSEVNALNSKIDNLDGSKTVSVSDYNNITTTGLYKAQAVSGASNPPDISSPGRWYNLYVWATANYVTQIAQSPDLNRMFVRSYFSGSGWTSWNELVTTKDTQFYKHYLGNNLSIALPKYCSAICTCIVSGIGSSVFTVVRAGTTITIDHLQGLQNATDSLTITAVDDATATIETTARDVQFSMMLSNVL